MHYQRNWSTHNLYHKSENINWPLSHPQQKCSLFIVEKTVRIPRQVPAQPIPLTNFSKYWTMYWPSKTNDMLSYVVVHLALPKKIATLQSGTYIRYLTLACWMHQNNDGCLLINELINLIKRSNIRRALPIM